MWRRLRGKKRQAEPRRDVGVVFTIAETEGGLLRVTCTAGGSDLGASSATVMDFRATGSVGVVVHFAPSLKDRLSVRVQPEEPEPSMPHAGPPQAGTES